ncbi:hypothetical protein cypCar_00034529 [Cyprinus carpio]|nr:hypothetical protein cypCar_00034529 [Cyprinus carpio]
MCDLQLLNFPFLKAIDEEVNKKEASFNPADNYSWEDPHAEVERDPNTQTSLMCSPAQLRQQTTELFATIDEVLEDSIQRHQSDHVNKANVKSLAADASRTKPGVIRPVIATSRFTDDEEFHPNPFKSHQGNKSNRYQYKRELHMQIELVRNATKGPLNEVGQPAVHQAITLKIPLYFAQNKLARFAHVMSATPGPAHIMSATPGPAHVMSATPEPLHEMAAESEPLHKMATEPEPFYVMTATQDGCHTRASHPADVELGSGLIASLMDPPLVSVRAAGIPRATPLAIIEAVPLSSVLPIIMVTILSVWAAHCTPEASPVHESAPEASPVHEYTPEASPVHSYTPEVSPIHESASEVAASTTEHPEVESSAAQPPEVK